MSRVLEHLREKQRSLASSSFINFLQDTRFAPQERLSFLPCVAPFVLGFAELGRSLMGGAPEESTEQSPDDKQNWAHCLKDLEALELDAAADFSGMLQLLWGSEGTQARRTLADLMELATSSSPVKCQMLIITLHAVGSASVGALELVAAEFEARTGKQLGSIHSLRAQLAAAPWTLETLELDLPADAEQEAIEAVDEVFSLIGETAEQLLHYAQERLAKEQPDRAWAASQTFQDFGNDRLRALCESVGYTPAEVQTVQRFFTAMSDGWGQRRIGTTPPWLSDITDDHTPYEFSVALEGEFPEVRFLIESQNNPTTLQTSWEDGLALNDRLNQEFGVPLDRFNLVKDLFEPRNPAARYSLWHAFGLKTGNKPAVKVYLNPQARGPENSRALVKEALERLGFANAWRFLSEVAMRRGTKDQLIYFSLDLSANRAARIKIYIAHQDATADDVEAIMSQTKEYVPGEAYAYYKKMLGSDGGFQVPRSTQTCLAFTSDDDVSPYHVTLYVPVRCYAKHDQEAMERIKSVLEPSRYTVLEKAVKALARRPLDAGVGLVQWASMRREAGKMRMTFYVASEAYSTSAPRWVTPEAPLFIPTEPAPAFNQTAPTT
jgi:hypothetical protein